MAWSSYQDNGIKSFNSFMIIIRYIQSEYDSCVYYGQLSNGSYIYMFFYVDDMLGTCNYVAEIKKVKA